MVFTLYSRLYCHLCEDMLKSLKQLQSSQNFELEVVDIDTHDELRQRYDTEVPVLAAGDEIICRHFFDNQAVTDFLSNG